MFFKVRSRSEAGEWTPHCAVFTTDENLENIRQTLELAPIIVEHRFYFGSSSPDRLVFDDYDNFIAYLESKAHAGDAIYVWNYEDLCRDDNMLVSGKCPAEDGCVSKKGTY